MLPAASDDDDGSWVIVSSPYKLSILKESNYNDWTKSEQLDKIWTTGQNLFRSDLLRSSKLDWKMLPAASDDDDGSWVIGKMLLWKLRRTL